MCCVGGRGGKSRTIRRAVQSEGAVAGVRWVPGGGLRTGVGVGRRRSGGNRAGLAVKEQFQEWKWMCR